MTTYGRHTADLEFCCTASAPDSIAELVERLNDGEADQLATEWSRGTLQKALDRLEGCISQGCPRHSSREAVQKLQAILDEELELDAQFAAEQAVRLAEEEARDLGMELSVRQLREIADRALRRLT